MDVFIGVRDTKVWKMNRIFIHFGLKYALRIFRKKKKKTELHVISIIRLPRFLRRFKFLYLRMHFFYFIFNKDKAMKLYTVFFSNIVFKLSPYFLFKKPFFNKYFC